MPFFHASDRYPASLARARASLRQGDVGSCSSLFQHTPPGLETGPRRAAYLPADSKVKVFSKTPAPAWARPRFKGHYTRCCSDPAASLKRWSEKVKIDIGLVHFLKSPFSTA